LLGGDRDSPLAALEGKTSQQVMGELLEMIKASGVLPTRLMAMISGSSTINVGRRKLAPLKCPSRTTGRSTSLSKDQVVQDTFDR
jgi:hypothetical protein